MIKDLKIENFKGFKDFEIKDFKQVNLITGKNNSGKSSLLEAINILYMPTDAYRINLIAYFDFKENACLSFFYKLNEKTPINISTSNNKHSLKINLLKEINTVDENNEKILSKESIKEDYGFSFKYEYLLNKQKQEHEIIISGQNRFKHRRSKSTFNLPTKLNNVNVLLIPEYAALYDDIQNIKQEDKIIKILNETINHYIKEIRIGQENSLKVDIGYDQLIPFYALGDGIKALFRILLSIYTTKEGIILIDEVENGFHYSVLPSVWKVILKAAKEFNVQVFATTHSDECIKAYYNAFKELNLPDDFINYYRLVKKDEEEIINYTQYTPDELGAAFEMNLEIRGA